MEHEKKKTGTENEEKVNSGKLVKFLEGSVILREGEVSFDMYRIVQGHAELYTGYGTEQEVLLGIIGKNTCFGEFGMLLHEPAIYTVVAYSDIYALRIEEGEMGDFVQNNHKNIIDIMRNMAKTMMIMQRQINLLADELEEGKKPDMEVLKKARRNMRGYAVYYSQLNNNPLERMQTIDTKG